MQNKQTYTKNKSWLTRKKVQFEKVSEDERNSFRVKRIKKLRKKIEKVKEELIEEKILLFFELGKELRDDYTWSGEKMIKFLFKDCIKVLRKLIYKCHLIKIRK